MLRHGHCKISAYGDLRQDADVMPLKERMT